MGTFTAAGIGEILWDMLPGERQLGGAPANFAYHFKALGGESLTISRIGDDEPGKAALAQLKEHGLDISAVTVDPNHMTGRVDVHVDANGVASYEFPDDVAWDHIEANDAATRALPTLDAVCFGTLAQRSPVSRRNITAMLQALPQKTLKIFDINLRQHFYSQELIESSLRMANVLKINDEELAIVGGMLAIHGTEQERMSRLIERFTLRLGVLTRGENGSLLMTPDQTSDFPGVAATVRDTIGAGDSFTAALALGWLQRLPLEEINQKAAQVAAHVCSQAGAMPVMPDTLRI
jgi:fructokinase